jgi:hypothetical protein
MKQITSANAPLRPRARRNGPDRAPKGIKPTPPNPDGLTPELKVFIDRAVVPVLVKAYLGKGASEKRLALNIELLDNHAVSGAVARERAKH